MSELRRHIMMQSEGGRTLALLSVNHAYINTLMKAQADTEFEITFLVPPTVSAAWIYGEAVGVNGWLDSFGAAINVIRFGNIYKTLSSYLNDGNLHTLNVTTERFILDGSIIQIGPSTYQPSTSGDYYIALYRAYAGSSLLAQPSYIARTRHWQSGVLVQELLPHYDETFGEWGFLDSVSGDFFRAETGRFEPVYI